VGYPAGRHKRSYADGDDSYRAPDPTADLASAHLGLLSN
jgi:hypothetical protein